MFNVFKSRCFFIFIMKLRLSKYNHFTAYEINYSFLVNKTTLLVPSNVPYLFLVDRFSFNYHRLSLKIAKNCLLFDSALEILSLKKDKKDRHLKYKIQFSSLKNDRLPLSAAYYIITIMFILRALLSCEARGFWFAARQCHLCPTQNGRHKWYWRVANQNRRVSSDNNARVNEHYYYYCKYHTIVQT